jgi:hypothetical protein
VSWSDFMYTVDRWLIPDDNDPSSMTHFQPLPSHPNEDWTDSFEICVEWFRAGIQKTIGGRKV